MCSCVSSVGRVRSVDLEPPFFRNGDFDWSRKANTAPRIIYRFGNEIDILGDLTNVGPVLDASDWSTPFFFYFDWSREAQTAPRLIYRLENEIDTSFGDPRWFRVWRMCCNRYRFDRPIKVQYLTNVGSVFFDASDWSTRSPWKFCCLGSSSVDVDVEGSFRLAISIDLLCALSCFSLSLSLS